MIPPELEIDVPSKEEALRILSPANSRALMRRRWEFVCELFDAGKAYKEIGKIIERAESTARRLHVYGRKQRVGWVRHTDHNSKRFHKCIHCVFYESMRFSTDYRCRYPQCHLNDFTTSPQSFCNWFAPRSKFHRPPPKLETVKAQFSASGHPRWKRWKEPWLSGNVIR